MLRFVSSAFTVTPGQDQETNPGIFGRALASWVSEQLIGAGFHPGGVIAEDFGWCVPVKSPPYPLYVVCASGELANHWQIFASIVPRRVVYESWDLGRQAYAAILLRARTRGTSKSAEM
jgi:hypothetical protein